MTKSLYNNIQNSSEYDIHHMHEKKNNKWNINDNSSKLNKPIINLTHFKGNETNGPYQVYSHAQAITTKILNISRVHERYIV